jgi:hypothetical protein
VPIAPIVHGADLPTPVVEKIESTHPLSDINERTVVTNPSTGRAEPGPGDFAVPGTTLVLQPKTPFGGWLRQEVGPEGITRSETKNVKPIKPNQMGEGAREAFNATQGEAEAENPLLAQLLAQKMKDPNLGVVGDQKLIQSLEAPHNIPEAPVSPSAPAEILNEVESFNQRRMEALNAAKSEAEAQQIAQQMEPEANALQLKLSLAERAASQKGEVLSPLLIRAGLGLGGAAIGGAANPDDPVSGAILGGAAGLGGAMALEKMRLPTGLRTPSASPLDRLGNLQRFGLLTNFPNLGVNMVAPVSGSALSSIEKMLAGRLAENPTIQNIAQQTGYDAGDPRLAELGRGGLRAMVNTMKSSWMPHFKEATRLIREAEEGRADMHGGTPSLIDSILQSPAYLMTAGDVGARTGLHGAGWTEGMAREATLTGEPRYKFTSGIANLSRKGGAVGRLFLPFAKTAANALEGSFERIPVIGLLARVSGDDPQLNASVAELAARQGMGAAVSFAAYEAGKRIDPETTKNLHLNAIITNMGGQYGPLAAAAFAAGQSSQDENGLVSNLMTGTQHLLRDTPLPTGEFLTQLINAGKAYANHEPPNPEGLNPLTRWAPRNMVPRFLDTDLLEHKQ